MGSEFLSEMQLFTKESIGKMFFTMEICGDCNQMELINITNILKELGH